MTRDQLITQVLQRVGKRTDLQADAELEILTVQAVLEEHQWLPWFLLTEDSSTTTTINEDRVEVPDDFLLEDDDQALWLYDSSNTDNAWKPLDKDELDVLRARYPGTGRPRAYALRGDYFILFPTPDAEYQLRMVYYGRDVALDTNVENKWTKHAPDLVIAELCLILAEEYIKDVESAAGFKEKVKRAWDRVSRKSIARAEAGMQRTMGDD